jgi:glutaconate CoA-transferase subunit A
MVVEQEVPEKVMPLSEAISQFVHDGDTVCVANFGSPSPYSAGAEIIRQGKRNLTAVLASSFFELDALAETGCLKKVITSYHSHLLSGERPFDRGVKKFDIEVLDYTNYTVAGMLMAGAMNLPFFPATPSLMLTDLYKVDGEKKFEVIDNPVNKGEKVVVVPPMNPDVALLHVQRVDKHGNAQLWGPLGTQKYGAMAAKKVIVTAEELVDEEVVKLSPNNTVVPGFRVDAVCIEPWGGHAMDCLGYYDIDIQFGSLMLIAARDEAQYAAWLDEWVFGVKDRKEYIDHYADRFGASRLECLKAKSLPSAAVNLGSSFMSEYESMNIDRCVIDNAPDLFEVEVEGND